MKRKLLDKLEQWKRRDDRKPLILRGARQVGKTYLLRQFGDKCYQNTIYLNFDRIDSDTARLFDGSIEPKRIIEFLSIKFSTTIDSEKTLLIFDEIQEVPRALTSLKYFMEEAPEYHIVAAGSLLGVALHEGTSFPVGKVEFMHLEPLSFEEFCWAIGLEAKLNFTIKDIDNSQVFSEDLADALQKYMIIGGMPEAVANWQKTKDINQVDKILSNILLAYKNDFNKYADTTTAERIGQVWQSIPSQFARESGKFVYGVIKNGARAREYELAITWLEDAGLIRKIYLVTRGDKLPLSIYRDIQSFKIYLLDIGLLRVMSGLLSSDMTSVSKLFQQSNGLFVEQFILQQISHRDPYYWSSGATSEVDFVIQANSQILPIEVKSGTNVKAKSLQVYRDKYQPRLAVRFSMKDLELNNGLLNIPLYYAWRFDELLEGYSR